MLKKQYLTDYLKIYTWQGIGTALDVLSMFIVIPAISQTPQIYGIYSVSISTSLFLKYADIGFLSSVFKYAGESFAKGDRNEEIRLFGFAAFILFIFISIIFGIYLFLALNPQTIIKDVLKSSSDLYIASNLLFIQAFFSFNTILTRISNGIFNIRVENYINQKLNIFTSIIKVLSVFYFFSEGRYDIIGYFLFLKSVDLLKNIITLFIIKVRYHYDFKKLLKSIKFEKEIYNKTKALALSSLFVTIMWILYYEIDLLVIGKILGPISVSIFAIAFTFIRFFRGLTSILFAPFQARYNHFKGLNDIVGLKTILLKVIQLTMPIIIFLATSVILLSDKVILSWVGEKYYDSSFILIILTINASFSFISIPSSEIIVVLEKIKSIYFVSALRTIFYWLGVYLLINEIQLLSFPIAKLISGLITIIIYLYIIINVLSISFLDFFNKTLLQIILPSICQIIFLLFIRDYLPVTKNVINLISVIGIGGISFILAAVLLYFSSKQYMKVINFYYNKLLMIRS